MELRVESESDAPTIAHVFFFVLFFFLLPFLSIGTDRFPVICVQRAKLPRAKTRRFVDTLMGHVLTRVPDRACRSCFSDRLPLGWDHRN